MNSFGPNLDELNRRHRLGILDEIVDREADRVLFVVLLRDVIDGDVINGDVFSLRHDVAAVFGQRHRDGAVGVGDHLRLDVPVQSKGG